MGRKRSKNSGMAPGSQEPTATFLEKDTDGVFMTSTEKNDDVEITEVKETVIETEIKVEDKKVEPIEEKYQQPIKINSEKDWVRVFCNETSSPFIGTQKWILTKGEVKNFPRFVADILAGRNKVKILGSANV